jgi:hypothetical protein
LGKEGDYNLFLKYKKTTLKKCLIYNNEYLEEENNNRLICFPCLWEVKKEFLTTEELQGENFKIFEYPQENFKLFNKSKFYKKPFKAWNFYDDYSNFIIFLFIILFFFMIYLKAN